MIYLVGGLPHQDMFDLKVNAPLEVRGEFNPISSSLAAHLSSASSVLAIGWEDPTIKLSVDKGLSLPIEMKVVTRTMPTNKNRPAIQAYFMESTLAGVTAPWEFMNLQQKSVLERISIPNGGGRGYEPRDFWIG